MNEKKYCIFCGAENSADVDTCCACGRTMHPEENLLKEYLYSKTKGKLQGKAEDSFLSVLKNWILSHLYGLVVTISIVTLATITVSASFGSQPPYVRRISSPLTPAEQALAAGSAESSVTAVPETPKAEEQNDEMAVSEEDINEVSHLISEFDFYYLTEITLAGQEFYFESEEEDIRERASLEECMVPEASGYRGEFVYGEPDHSQHNYDQVVLEPGEPVVNEPATELGERIMADGHPIVVYHVTNHYSGMGTEFTRSFVFTATRLDGTWYFAEVISQGDL
ncbi:MAG: hypothetical protein Q4D24_08265 [Erysipelotrichaceae bacterium]|nr:hypothetical protein [Erysipelotrichaceae bacterium]